MIFSDFLHIQSGLQLLLQKGLGLLQILHVRMCQTQEDVSNGTQCLLVDSASQFCCLSMDSQM